MKTIDEAQYIEDTNSNKVKEDEEQQKVTIGNRSDNSQLTTKRIRTTITNIIHETTEQTEAIRPIVEVGTEEVNEDIKIGNFPNLFE